MPNIKIIDKQNKPSIPKSSGLCGEVPRFKPAGGKPPLPMDKSFSPQAKKQREN